VSLCHAQLQQKNGLVLSSRIDQHAGNPQARLLIGAILKADPSE
jgi:hypothetical protein